MLTYFVKYWGEDGVCCATDCLDDYDDAMTTAVMLQALGFRAQLMRVYGK